MVGGVVLPDLQLAAHLAPDAGVAPVHLAAVVAAGALREAEGGGKEGRERTCIRAVRRGEREADSRGCCGALGCWSAGCRTPRSRSPAGACSSTSRSPPPSGTACTGSRRARSSLEERAESPGRELEGAQQLLRPSIAHRNEAINRLCNSG